MKIQPSSYPEVLDALRMMLEKSENFEVAVNNLLGLASFYQLGDHPQENDPLMEQMIELAIVRCIELDRPKGGENEIVEKMRKEVDLYFNRI